MTLLIKKFQKGGRQRLAPPGNGLFANPLTMDLGARSLIPLLGGQPRQQSSGYRPRSTSYGNSKSKSGSTEQPLKDGLPSDIKYYQLKKNQLTSRLEEIMLDDVSADETAEYNRIIQELHELETVYKPQIKGLHAMYKKAEAHYLKEDAADLPAITNGMAFVVDMDAMDSYNSGDKSSYQNIYKMVNTTDLLKDAKKYKLLYATDVLREKANNPFFSGFTKMGEYATSYLTNLYGQDSYINSINKKLAHLGYTKQKNFIVGPNGEIRSSDLTKKTNAPQLKQLLKDVSSDFQSMQSQYIYNTTIASLYRQSVVEGGLDLGKKSDKELKEILSKSYSTNLENSVMHALISDMELSDEGGSPAGASRDKLGKDRKYNIVTVAASRLGNEEESGIEFPIDDGSSKTSLLYSAKNAYIDNGYKLLDLGFKMGTDENDEQLPRFLKNNQIVNNMLAGVGKISTLDGKDLYDITDPEYVTIAPGTNVHLVLAPIERRKGKDYVTFDSEYSQKMAEAMDKVYVAWAEAGVDRVKALNDEKEKKRAQAISEKILKETFKADNIKPPKNLRLGLAAAFDVIYMAEGANKNYKYH